MNLEISTLPYILLYLLGGLIAIKIASTHWGQPKSKGWRKVGAYILLVILSWAFVLVLLVNGDDYEMD